MEQIPLVLLSALQFMGMSVVLEGPFCTSSPLNMGEYHIVSESINVCEKNAKKLGISIDQIIRHEMIHAIHKRFRLDRKTLTPEPLFTTLVQKNLDSEEVMSVLSDYDRDHFNQEVEARLLEKLMDNEEVAALGLTSQVFFKATAPKVNSLPPKNDL
jgi:hypothetical protein